MNFNANDFKIVHGDTMEEIEAQVKILFEEGYCLHGTVVAQPNPRFNSDVSGSQRPYHYYQMLAKYKTKPLATETASKMKDNIWLSFQK